MAVDLDIVDRPAAEISAGTQAAAEVIQRAASVTRCYSWPMRKRSITLGVLAVVTGWGLGWYTHDRWGLRPDATRATARILSPASSSSAPATGVVTAPPRNGKGDMAQLLERKAFARAVERYEALQGQADDTMVQRAREQLLAHARRLVAQGDYGSAMQLLQRYLHADYRDVQARMLLAEVYRGRHELRAAIDQLYEAKGQAWRPQVLERLDRQIRALVVEYAQTLKQRGDNSGLLALYQDLTQLEPSYAPYFIGLAVAQLAFDDSDAARQSLLLVAQDSQVGAKARELLERVRVATVEPQQPEASAAASAVAGIPLLRSGSHFLVEARLGGTQPARLLIDTGASLTMLTADALKRRGIGAHATGKTGTFNTANGRVRAPIYRLDSLSVGDWQVSDLEVGVLELGDRRIDGLLGMNFLRHFQFFIDQDAALLRLSIATEPG
jgi:clan AA aspartic protease (TIGR02281 family)